MQGEILVLCRAMSRSPIVRLLKYARAYRPKVILATACSVLNKLFDVMPEILIGIAIDVVVRRENSFVSALGVTDATDQIYLLAFLTFLIWAGESLFEYLYLVLWRNLAQSLQHDLRIDAARHVLDLDMSWFEDRSSGGLTAILNDDVNQLERFLNGGANALIQTLTSVIAVGGVFFFVSPTIAWLAFTPIPVILIGAFWFQKRAQPLYAGVREKVEVLAARLAGIVSGIATIKAFTAEREELDQLKENSDDYRKINRRAIAVSSAFIPIIRMAILAGFLFTFVVGGIKTLNGELNVGAYGVLVFLTQRLLWPMTSLAETIDLYERSMASTRRILNLIQTPIRIRDRADAVALEKVAGEIRFESVDFAYSDGHPVLHEVSFIAGQGKNIAFVGSTGSGKSTIMKLLLRFYAPSSGRILLDGHDLSALRMQDLRANVGLVSQDIFLFHGSVRDNIRYGRRGASDAEIEEAARVSEAAEFIARLPQGYDTVVGERGQKLSGGQRQRLSIARAVLKNPPVLLLDEATSAVDNETEAAIQRSLARIVVGRTTLIVAHRLSTIVHADAIHVLEHGRIVESGTHSELIERGGAYAALWSVQTGDAVVV